MYAPGDRTWRAWTEARQGHGSGGTDENHVRSRGRGLAAGRRLMRSLLVALAVVVAAALVTWVLAASIAQVANPPGALELLVLFTVTATGGWVLAHRNFR
jgi:hypothetical protein